MKKLLFSVIVILVSLFFSCWEETKEGIEVKTAPKLLNKILQVNGSLEKDSSIFLWAYINGEVESFQWFKNDSLLNDNYDSLFIDTLSFSDTGLYRLIISNSGGSDTSDYYSLKLDTILEVLNNKPVFAPNKPDTLYETSKGTVLNIIFSATDADSADSNLLYWVTSTSLPATVDTATVDTLFIWNTDTVGTFSIVFNVSDGKDTVSKISTVKITDKIINDTTNSAPEFMDNKPALSYNVKKGSSLVIPFEATDQDSDDVSLLYWITSTNLPSNVDTGIVDTNFIWNTDTIGTFSIMFNVTDGKDTVSKTSIVKISEEIINDTTNSVPEFAINKPALSYVIDEGNSLIIPFEASDADSEDSVLAFWIKSLNLPSAADTSINDSQFIWSTPTLGEYSISVYVSDGKDTSIANVNIKVEEVTGGPVITIEGYQKGQSVEVNENDTLKLSLTVTNDDQTDVSVIQIDTVLEGAGELPEGLSGTWMYIPSYNVASIKTNRYYFYIF